MKESRIKKEFINQQNDKSNNSKYMKSTFASSGASIAFAS